MASIPDPPGPGGESPGPEGDGGYEVGAPIREGWGGTLNSGRYQRSGLQVTVQDIRQDLVATAGLVERLGQLGRETAQVRDPHLLVVYDLVDDGGMLRLIAEWSDAPALAATLRRGALPGERAVAVVDDILAGLAALHDAGLFHGHVGPETVVIEADGRARLAELAICAAAAPPGAGAQTDVRDAARLGLHMLRAAGRRFDAVRRPLDAATAEARGASPLREELGAGAAAALGAGWRERLAAAPPRPVKRRRRMVLAVLAAAVVAAAAATAIVLLAGGRGGPLPAGPLVVGGDTALTVSPPTGGCDTTFTFAARGSLSGVGTLVYRWEQSDGQLTADTPLAIGPSEGSFLLTEAWRLQGSQTVDGGMTLHILKPVDRRITKSFRYSCP